MRKPNYDKYPVVAVSGYEDDCSAGWAEIATRLGSFVKKSGRYVLAIECYSGVRQDEIEEGLLTALKPARTIATLKEAFKSPKEIDELVAPDLGGNDPIFGFYTRLKVEDFLDSARRKKIRESLSKENGLVVVIGPGATLCCEPDGIVYADMPRWEEQMRQRRGEVSNLGVSNAGLKASLLYKRAFFIDWRACDRLKRATMDRWDFLLDTTVANEPRLISGDAFRDGLRQAAQQPFRVVPFFDPGPWGGQWMKEVCDLDRSAPNYAWCFDCVPEENSLVLGFGDKRVEIPAIDLVFHNPKELLGEAVYGLFGAEFPIRFDFLDTMGGGNLSFQVHPLVDYAQQHFGLHYTQDESYYMLDVGDDACVYLGMKEGARVDDMMEALEKAQAGEASFDDAKYVAKWPAKKHDHFLIPAGTCHCSGTNSMVLEISHTPYIFTFKLWDWGRMGLDGLPRPINLERGRAVIQAERDEKWVKENLINAIEQIGEGDGWKEERTGLYRSEFIETRRHWFTKAVTHRRTGSVEVLNLIEGNAAVVESPTGAFAPFTVHYAETFIVPAEAGDYVIRPSEAGEACATLKAYIRVSGKN